MRKEIHQTNSAAQTKQLGRKLAKKLLSLDYPKSEIRGAFVLALKGELGSGKTTFLQGFAEGLGIKERILSPTFVLIKKFRLKALTPKDPALFGKRVGQRFKNFYHIDCYRLEYPKELLSLGLKEILQDSQNIVAIEWAEKIKRLLPSRTIFLRFKIKGFKKREILLDFGKPHPTLKAKLCFVFG